MFNKNNQQTTATILLYFCKKSWATSGAKITPIFSALPRMYFWLQKSQGSASSRILPCQSEPPWAQTRGDFISLVVWFRDWKGTRCRFGTRSSRRPHVDEFWNHQVVPNVTFQWPLPAPTLTWESDSLGLSEAAHVLCLMSQVSPRLFPESSSQRGHAQENPQLWNKCLWRSLHEDFKKAVSQPP